MDSDVTDSEENSDLPSQELADRVAECVPANTRKTTEWAVTTYRRWAQRRPNVRYVKEDLLAYRNDLQALDRVSSLRLVTAHTLVFSATR